MRFRYLSNIVHAVLNAMETGSIFWMVGYSPIYWMKNLGTHFSCIGLEARVLRTCTISENRVRSPSFEGNPDYQLENYSNYSHTQIL